MWNSSQRHEFEGPGGAGGPAQSVTLVVARGCHLCELAREALGPLRAELGFALEELDITGVPELERRYRKWLPVIEVEGERVSVYRVEPERLRERLLRQ